ncbi:UNVERIFIED_CONTAM: hypothetical protein FKN15_031378 [Acipenser sinensis]
MERLAAEERPHQSGGETVAPSKRSGRRGGLPGVLLASGEACGLTAVMASAPSIKTNKFDGAIAEANERSETENGEAQKCVLTLSTGERRDYTALLFEPVLHSGVRCALSRLCDCTRSRPDYRPRCALVQHHALLSVLLLPNCSHCLSLCSTLVYAVHYPGCVTARGQGQAIACAAPWCSTVHFSLYSCCLTAATGACVSTLAYATHYPGLCDCTRLRLGACQCPRASVLQSLDTLGARRPSMLQRNLGPQSLDACGALIALVPSVPRHSRVRCPQCLSPLGALAPSGPQSLSARGALGALVLHYLDAPQCFGTFWSLRASVHSVPLRPLAPRCLRALVPSLLWRFGASALYWLTTPGALHPWTSEPQTTNNFGTLGASASSVPQCSSLGALGASKASVPHSLSALGASTHRVRCTS